MSFSDFEASAEPLFKEFKILKVTDIAKMNNLLFVHDSLNKHTPVHFSTYFEPYIGQNAHNAVNNPTSVYSFPKGSLKLPSFQNQHGQKSIKYSLAKMWNDFLKEIAQSTYVARSVARPNDDTNVTPVCINSMSRSHFKQFVKNHLITH